MAQITLLDDSFPFDGDTLRSAALGGVQGATVMLAEALAARGHRVSVATAGDAWGESFGVRYQPLDQPGEPAELLIANRVPALFARPAASAGGGAKGTRARALWLHGPARYLRKPRHLLPLLRYRPVPVFLGAYHAGTRPWGLPLHSGPVIGHGIGEVFLTAPLAQAPPPPRAIFTSNPRRGLDWLVELWCARIRPAVPTAELHVFSGRATYGGLADAKLEQALAAAVDREAQGIYLRAPVAKEALAHELRQARVMLYRGDLGETFCFAAAEAQAMGVPLVTAGIGALAERLVDGVTGFLRPEPEPFARAAIALLQDDALWLSQHQAAASGSRTTGGWALAAARWEQAFLE